MDSAERKRRRPRTPVFRGCGAIGVLALLAAACAREADGVGDRTEDEAAASPVTPVTNLGRILQIRGDTVEFKMDEYIFGLPTLTLPAGDYVFHIQNLGFEAHNVEILRGDSLVAKLDGDLDPAQVTYLQVSFEPGDYELVCTLAGHDSKGMRETLTIVPPESASVTDGGVN